MTITPATVAHATTAAALHRESWLRGVVATHVLFRVALWLGGVPLVSSPLQDFWQVADVALLRAAPLQTLWYLHAQPPLYNATIAAVVRLPTGLQEPTWRLLLAVFSLFAVVAVYVLSRRLGARPGLAAAASLALSLSPELVGHELLVFYTVPVLAMLLATMVAIERAGAADPEQRWRWIGAAMSAGAAICLTRSLFHLLWLILVGALLVWWHRPDRRTLLVVLLPILVVAAWFAKVAVQQGSFGSSTWFGQSLARSTIHHLTPAERQELVDDGILSELALRPPFQAPYHYADLVDLPDPTGVPILDQVRNAAGFRNLHSAGVPPVSAAFQHEAIAAAKARPVVIWRQAVLSTCFLLRPADNSVQMPPLEGAFSTWRSTYNRGVLLQARTPDPLTRCELASSGPLGFWTLSPTALLLVLAPIVTAAQALNRRRKKTAEPRDLTWLAMAFTIAFVVGVSTFFEWGENYRFRFLVEPFGWIALAVLADQWMVRRPSRG